MNIISYSCYGPQRKYWEGILRNIDLRDKFYPGWFIRVYCDQDNFLRFTGWSTARHAGEYSFSPNVTFEFGYNDWCPLMMQRYLVCDKPSTDRVIFRDADSRLSQREADAINAWIDSDKICLILRDHPAHVLIPGGLLGLQPRRDNWEMPKMKGMIEWFLERSPIDVHGYGADQHFLATKIWPMFRESMLQFDACPGRRNELKALPWPTKRTDYPRFVGEVMEIDEHGNEFPRLGDWESCPKE